METLVFLMWAGIALAGLYFFFWGLREKRRHHFTVGDVSEVPVEAYFYVLGVEDVWYRKRGPQAFDRVWGHQRTYTLHYEPTTARLSGQVRWTRSALLAKRWVFEEPSQLPAWSERDGHAGTLMMVVAGLAVVAAVVVLTTIL